jgi:hypothetical protein
MKKLIAIVAAVSMLATPALADAHGRNDGQRHRHGVSTEGAVAIGLGALILGGAIASSNRQRSTRTQEPRYEPQYQPQYQAPVQYQYVCQNEYVRDYYGNYILDQYGRAIFRQRCWYQQ